MRSDLKEFVLKADTLPLQGLLRIHNALHDGDTSLSPKDAAIANAALRSVFLTKGLMPVAFDYELEERTLLFLQEQPSEFSVVKTNVENTLQTLEPVEKIGAQLWGSSAGKTNIANQLLPLFPTHTTYVEPFFGGGALFWAKEKAAKEIVNDLTPMIPMALQFIRDMNDATMQALQRKNWKPITRDQFYKLMRWKPTTNLDRIYQFIKLKKTSFMRLGTSFDHTNKGGRNIPNQLPKARERLQGVKVFNKSYQTVVKAFDSPEAFMFLDPPYVKTEQHVGETEFNHAEFWSILAQLRGKFLVTYDVPAPEQYKQFYSYKLEHRRTRGPAGVGTYLTYVITNYAIDKSLLDQCKIEPHSANTATPTNTTSEPTEEAKTAKTDEVEKTYNCRVVAITKQEDQQVVLGVVSEPDTVDAHNERISAEEIARAAHQWLAKYQNTGYMHVKGINHKVEIWESYIAPQDLTIEGQHVRKGSWLLMCHVLDQNLWNQIKNGEITGYSIGGFARIVRE